jgi:hypothetical protein
MKKCLIEYLSSNLIIHVSTKCGTKQIMNFIGYSHNILDFKLGVFFFYLITNPVYYDIVFWKIIQVSSQLFFSLAAYEWFVRIRQNHQLIFLSMQ